MVIGFIGLGNMAKAIIGGILGQQIVHPEDIVGSSATQGTMDAVAKEYGIRTTPSNKAVAREADILILAVKPVVLPVVLEEIMDDVDENKLIISIAAGRQNNEVDQPVLLQAGENHPLHAEYAGTCAGRVFCDLQK